MDETRALDPIDYEVVRNRLLAVTDEMRIALQSVSGSPTVTEATDFFTGLYVPDGSFATMGQQVTHEAAPVGNFIRHLLRTDTVTLERGDMFIGNDPYVGALHQNDVQMACPIFDGDEIIAWAGVMAHETDVGGMDFASWSPNAREVYQEGLRIPAVKLVDGGQLRADVLELIVTASRLPQSLELDIRAFIATLNVARDRILDLTGRYGAPMVMAAMQRMIETSEARVRRRLRELPDADVHVTDYVEHDGHDNRLYRVDLRLSKRGDQLTMDFGGSSPQAQGFINATRAGLMGGITGGLIPTLGFGIPWNAGLLRPLDVRAPDGLICTAQHPAPVGSATVETVWVVTNVVCRGLNFLLAASDEHRHRAQAVSSGTMATFNLGGVNQFGERFGMHFLDPLAGGSGAFAGRDGIDAGGPPAVPVPQIADVESNEQVAPLLYLHRRLRRDTGGAGRYRGGHSAEIAVTVHGVEEVEALIMTHGALVPNSAGMFGGLPGATVEQRIGAGALRDGYPSGALPHDPLSLAEEIEVLGPKPGRRTLRRGDVFSVSWQGGGGWGDPLIRE
ncbi:MAG: hydantoinase B/oxoprolinase family protein, partial [Gemmatimonadota bacterium]